MQLTSMEAETSPGSRNVSMAVALMLVERDTECGVFLHRDRQCND